MEFAVAAKCASEQQRRNFANLTSIELLTIENCLREIPIEVMFLRI